MSRTKLKNRLLPHYTVGEECMNTVTHIVGGGLSILMALLCIVKSSLRHNALTIIGCCIYGSTLILLYTMSSIYHGLKPTTAKKVLQVLDHCAIYLLIAGTYTPILLTSIRSVSSLAAWCIFILVWGLCALAATLTAIDLKQYSVFSMICYIFMGWCIMLIPKVTLQAIPLRGFWFLLSGGIVYSIGAVLYGLGKRKRYMHALFHLFVIAGSILQFICIYFYIL